MVPLRILRRRNTLALLGVIFLILGFGTAKPAVIYLASVYLLMLILGYVTSSTLLPRVSASREAHPRAFQGDTVNVALTIHNATGFSLPLVEIEDYFTPDEVPSKQLLVSEAVRPRSVCRVEYPGTCMKRRGMYTIGPIKLTLSDPLGLFEPRRTIGDTMDFAVYPEILPLERIPVEGRSNVFSFGRENSLLAGRSLDFFGVREYAPGDPIRHIHWPSTARMGEVIVREFERTVTDQATILLDLQRSSIAGLGEHSTPEYVIKMAAALAHHSLQRGHEVQMLGMGEGPLDVPFGRGSQHEAFVLEELAKARPRGRTPLPEVLRFNIDRIPDGSTLVQLFASVSVQMEAFADTWALLRSRRVRILAVLIDDTTFLQLDRYRQRVDGVSVELVEARSRLLDAGVPTVVVCHGDDLARALGSFPSV